MNIIDLIEDKRLEWHLKCYTPAKYLHLRVEHYSDLMLNSDACQVLEYRGLTVIPTFSCQNHISLGL